MYKEGAIAAMDESSKLYPTGRANKLFSMSSIKILSNCDSELSNEALLGVDLSLGLQELRLDSESTYPKMFETSKNLSLSLPIFCSDDVYTFNRISCTNSSCCFIKSFFGSGVSIYPFCSKVATI